MVMGPRRAPGILSAGALVVGQVERVLVEEHLRRQAKWRATRGVFSVTRPPARNPRRRALSSLMTRRTIAARLLVPAHFFRVELTQQ